MMRTVKEHNNLPFTVAMATGKQKEMIAYLWPKCRRKQKKEARDFVIEVEVVGDWKIPKVKC